MTSQRYSISWSSRGSTGRPAKGVTLMYKHVWYCRWDGKTYRPLRETDRDGFCCSACKQALYRAHKKYVTAKKPARAAGIKRPVTRKTRRGEASRRSPKRKKIDGYRCLGCNHSGPRKIFETGNPQHPLKCPACKKRPGFQLITVLK